MSKRATEPVAKLHKAQRTNSAYQLRIDRFRWNISEIARALNYDRSVIRKRLAAAQLQPDGHVHGTPVYELARAIPVVFGEAPRSPKR